MKKQISLLLAAVAMPFGAAQANDIKPRTLHDLVNTLGASCEKAHVSEPSKFSLKPCLDLYTIVATCQALQKPSSQCFIEAAEEGNAMLESIGSSDRVVIPVPSAP